MTSYFNGNNRVIRCITDAINNVLLRSVYISLRVTIVSSYSNSGQATIINGSDGIVVTKHEKIRTTVLT